MFDRIASLTPEEFERHTEAFLRRLGGRLKDFTTTRREKVAGLDGAYEIDVTVRFEALGAEFMVLVECKHHNAPIKREVVQVLRDRLQSTGAQKGMLFATAPFQSGAVEYAKAHRIALVRVTDRDTIYQTRSMGRSDGPLVMVSAVPRVDSEGGVAYRPVDISSKDELWNLTSWPQPSLCD